MTVGPKRLRTNYLSRLHTLQRVNQRDYKSAYQAWVRYCKTCAHSASLQYWGFLVTQLRLAGHSADNQLFILNLLFEFKGIDPLIISWSLLMKRILIGLSRIGRMLLSKLPVACSLRHFDTLKARLLAKECAQTLVRHNFDDLTWLLVVTRQTPHRVDR